MSSPLALSAHPMLSAIDERAAERKQRDEKAQRIIDTFHTRLKQYAFMTKPADMTEADAIAVIDVALTATLPMFGDNVATFLDMVYVSQSEHVRKFTLQNILFAKRLKAWNPPLASEKDWEAWVGSM